MVSVEFEGHCPSSNQAVTLDQCIELFTQPETLSKEEAWSVEGGVASGDTLPSSLCKGHTPIPTEHT